MTTEWGIAVGIDNPCSVCGNPTRPGDLVLLDTYKLHGDSGAECMAGVWCTACAPEPEPPLDAFVGYPNVGEPHSHEWHKAWQWAGWNIGGALRPVPECPGKANLIASKHATLCQLKRWVKFLEDELA